LSPHTHIDRTRQPSKEHNFHVVVIGQVVDKNVRALPHTNVRRPNSFAGRTLCDLGDLERTLCTHQVAALPAGDAGDAIIPAFDVSCANGTLAKHKVDGCPSTLCHEICPHVHATLPWTGGIQTKDWACSNTRQFPRQWPRCQGPSHRWRARWCTSSTPSSSSPSNTHHVMCQPVRLT